jgi:uncharacterized protein
MIWERIARFVLKFRMILLVLLFTATVFMGFRASHVQMSYEFTKAIPVDHPTNLVYQAFRKKFGDDGNLLVIGIQTPRLFEQEVFNEYIALNDQLKKIHGVEEVLGIPSAISLVKIDSARLIPFPIFPDQPLSQAAIDSGKQKLLNLIFYRGLLYNPQTNSYLIAINVNRNLMNSPARVPMVRAITAAGDAFGKKVNIEMHYSGLPLIRTNIAIKEESEMKWFLISSVLLSALILLLFFRSLSSMALSLSVVLIGVVWSLGTMDLCGYKITLLSVLIPPLIVVIGIPNCIYFLNKYHTAYNEQADKMKAIYEMIRKMGVVTLFCNISAAIGFAVFALTNSPILKEFGVVSGINIMMLFFISFILIPGVLSYLPNPKKRHTRYLENRQMAGILNKIERITLSQKPMIYGLTTIVLIVSLIGIFRIRSEGFIVDDLPKTDPIYTDLKFFEKNFKGIMPLDIVIDTKRKKGFSGPTALQNFDKMDQLSTYIDSFPQIAKPLSLVEGIKFIRQEYYGADSADYSLPTQYDIVFLAPYLNMRPSDINKKNSLIRLLNSFIDSNKQQARISVNMADVGTRRLPEILNSIEKKSAQLFDSTKYNVVFTGSSMTFLAGSDFIITGLKQSIMWAFLLIAACMLYLFRSIRILFCSLIPNMIPLLITAGVMGWTGVPLKPSTVLVFSIALGIAIDITIRFLVNYKQELGKQVTQPNRMVINTIHSTGISIIYTSLVLIAGFIIFCFSGFDGTKALGWLTSLTLVMATLTNLIFLPALLMSLNKKSVVISSGHLDSE